MRECSQAGKEKLSIAKGLAYSFLMRARTKASGQKQELNKSLSQRRWLNRVPPEVKKPQEVGEMHSQVAPGRIGRWLGRAARGAPLLVMTFYLHSTEETRGVLGCI